MLVPMLIIDGMAETSLFHSSIIFWLSPGNQQKNDSEISKLSEHDLHTFFQWKLPV